MANILTGEQLDLFNEPGSFKRTGVETGLFESIMVGVQRIELKLLGC